MIISTRLDTRPKPPKNSGRGQQAFAYLLLLLLSLALLSSCGVSGPVKRQAPACSTATNPIQAAHQPYRVLATGFDISSSFPRPVFEQAKRAVADTIDRMVQPNSSGSTIFLNWIT